MAKDSFVIDDEKHFSQTKKIDEKFRKFFEDMEKEFEESKKED